MQALNKTQKKPGKPTVRSLDEAIMLLATSMADMSKQIKESNARTDRLIAESNARTDRQIAASNARMEKMIAESKDIVDRLSIKVDRLSEDFGCVGNRQLMGWR
jgi:hypothetical protein